METPRIACLIVVVSLLAPTLSSGIPNSFIGNGAFIGPIIPAHPRFGANLTADFLLVANWEGNAFPGPWEPVTSLAGQEVRQMTAMPVLFGAVPDSVIASGEGGAVTEIVITYLDAGTFFPFQAGGEKSRDQREDGVERRAEFDSQWHRLDRNLRERLEAGCGRGELIASGRSDLLRTVYTEYVWAAFRLRLARREGHSVSLHLSLAAQPAPGPVVESIVRLDRKARADFLADRVRSMDSGGVVIDGIPVFDQGFTPYCGVHALAMVAHYHGLRLLPGTLAAGADFSNTGSARGSRIPELYRAVGEELGLEFATSSKFDPERIEHSLRAGLPVVVWRRVSREREMVHADFAARLTGDPGLSLPTLNGKDLAELPDRTRKGSPSHASVICGIDPKTGTVTYLEPWGESAHRRQMRAEELEATVYAAFFYEP